MRFYPYGAALLSLLIVAAGCRPPDQSSKAPARSSALRAARVAAAPAAAVAALDKALAPARKTVAQAQARAAEWQNQPVWTNLSALTNMIADIDALRASGNIADAYEKATAYALNKARQRVVDQILQAMPLLVIGAFGNPDWTDLTNPAQPIRSSFNGYRTPFLKEYQESNWRELVHGRPDLTNTYTGMFQHRVMWQTAVKDANCLTLDAFCPDASHWGILYIYTEIFSPDDHKVSFVLGSEFQYHPLIWVNNGMGYDFELPGQKWTPDPRQRQLHFNLKPGWNPVLMKLLHRRGARFYWRIVEGWSDSLTDMLEPVEVLRFRIPEKTGT